MGNNSNQAISNNENQNNNKPKEKDEIFKGTYQDKFNVKESDPKDFYDLIINIDTFSPPNIKWKIETNEPEKISKLIKGKKIEDNNNNNIDNQIKDEIIDNNNEQNEIKDEIIENDNEQNEIKDEIIEHNNKQNQIKDINNYLIDNESNKSVIGILGLGNVGKSYLLSLFINQELPTGDSIHTKGISIKKIKNYIILDSEGVDAALTKTNISNELLPKEKLFNKSINESDSLIEKIARDKKAVELFIQDFIIEKSDILVIVVGQLTLQEQKMINRIVMTANKKIIYVIHNLKNFYCKEQINDYIENIFKKNIFFAQNQKYSEQTYKGKNDLENKEEEYDTYFLETYDNSRQVLHFIMGSNVKESNNYFFNKTVIDYFRNEISSFKRKKFHIFDELKDFLIKKGTNYIESSEACKKPFTEEDITLVEKEQKIYISIKNEKNRIKKCLMNQLGFSHFYGALYSPNYTYYIEKDEKTNKDINLIVEIIAPGEGIFEFDTPRREILSEGHKTILTFTGTKTLKKHKDFELGGGNMDSGSFRIDIYLDCDEIHLKENATITKQNLRGAVRYIYPLTDKSDLNNEMKEIEFNFSNNKKEKEQKNK